MVRPGELNLMTAGAGICHSEVSTAATTVLHGVQLWVALPDSDRDTGRDFAHYAPAARLRAGAPRCGCSSASWRVADPPCTRSRRCSARRSTSTLAHGVDLDIDPSFEHGVLLDQGRLEICGRRTRRRRPGVPGHRLRRPDAAQPGDGPARAVLLGGPPFGEELVMWWNFVGRSHDDIAAYRRLWEDHDDPLRRRRGLPRRRRAAARSPASERHVAATAEPEGNSRT